MGEEDLREELARVKAIAKEYWEAFHELNDAHAFADSLDEYNKSVDRFQAAEERLVRLLDLGEIHG